MRQTKLQLSEEDRAVIHDIRMKGLHQAREVNRAHVLASLDQGVPEAQIMAVRGIGRTAVWRMYALLELYARPLRTAEPVICIDEKSLQLIAHSRPPLPGTMPFRVEHSPTKQDCEYVRNGTTNLFVAVEPKAGRRIVEVTAQRGKIDFVTFVGDLLTNAYAKGLCQWPMPMAYAKARRVHLVLDNLNTHFRKSFDDVMGKRAAAELLRRVQFHYTPKHARWLNMAEIEIGVLSRQCLD